MNNIIKNTADNAGGLYQLSFAPVQDIVSIPEPNDGIITEPVVMQEDKAFYNLDLTLDTAGVKVAFKQTPDGPVWEVAISGFIAGDAPYNQQTFQEMMFSKMIVIGNDNNENKRIFGTLENGCIFSCEFDTKSGFTSLKGTKIAFTGVFDFNPYFYQSSMIEYPDGINPGPDTTALDIYLATWLANADISSKVRAVVLTGLSVVSNVAITAADSVLSAFGKLQTQINSIKNQIPFFETNENKRGSLIGADNITYPTTLAVSNAIASAEGNAQAYTDLVAAGLSDDIEAAEQNAKDYAESLVVGLWDDRGNFDASGNTFPSSGGSGAAGAILKGDIWTVSVAGTLGGQAVNPGDTVRALVDTPGTTASNWSIQEGNLGYAPLSPANNLNDLNDAATARNNLGLGNVENKSSATIRGEITSGNVTTALGYTPANQSEVARWVSVSLTRTDFSIAATTNTINIYEPPAGARLEAVELVPTSRFNGGGVTDAFLSVGTSFNPLKFSREINMYDIPADYALMSVVSHKVGTSAEQVVAKLTTFGANISALTSGAITIRLKISQ